MAATKKDAASEDTATASARLDTDTKPVVDLLASILSQVQTQVQSRQPKQLEGKALEAVDRFREIVAALTLQPNPTIKLTAVPTEFDFEGGEVTLTWLSTGAQRVSIDPDVGPPVGEVEPAAGGSIVVRVLQTTTFTSTGTGPCSSATAKATVTVVGIG